MTDRRRINGPSGATAPPSFSVPSSSAIVERPHRTRKPEELRKIFLKSGLAPSASGSAYFELAPSVPAHCTSSLIPGLSSLKLTCTVHGPHPLPRSAPFSSQLVLTTSIKFAPFASRLRRGYIRDSAERDLAVHLETALRGMVIGERWPKSGIDVIVTVLEGEDDAWWGDEMGLADTDSGRQGAGDVTAGGGGAGAWGMMSVLAGCITVASAAIADAGMDCVDLASGGVAAIVRDRRGKRKDGPGVADAEQLDTQLVLDPCPSEHQELLSACVVAYLEQRDELTEVWMKGDAGTSAEELIDGAVKAAMATRTVLAAVVQEAAELKFPVVQPQDNTVGQKKAATKASQDVEMAG